jgi:hypothetical protein
LAILENSRGAMRLDSVLLIVERLLPERIECCEAHREITMMDLHMLVMPGGRERTGVERRPRAHPDKADRVAVRHHAGAQDRRPHELRRRPRRGASPMNRGFIVLAGAGLRCPCAVRCRTIWPSGCRTVPATRKGRPTADRAPAQRTPC